MCRKPGPDITVKPKFTYTDQTAENFLMMRAPLEVFRQVIRMLNPEVRRVLLRARMLQAVATAPVEEVPLNNIRSLVNHIQALPEEQIPQPRDPPAAEVPEAVPAVDEKNSSPPEEGENGEEDQETD